MRGGTQLMVDEITAEYAPLHLSAPLSPCMAAITSSITLSIYSISALAGLNLAWLAIAALCIAAVLARAIIVKKLQPQHV